MSPTAPYWTDEQRLTVEWLIYGRPDFQPGDVVDVRIGEKEFVVRVVRVEVNDFGVIKARGESVGATWTPESPCAACGSYGHFTHNHPREKHTSGEAHQ